MQKGPCCEHSNLLVFALPDTGANIAPHFNHTVISCLAAGHKNMHCICRFCHAVAIKNCHAAKKLTAVMHLTSVVLFHVVAFHCQSCATYVCSTEEVNRPLRRTQL